MLLLDDLSDAAAPEKDTQVTSCRRSASKTSVENQLQTLLSSTKLTQTVTVICKSISAKWLVTYEVDAYWPINGICSSCDFFNKLILTWQCDQCCKGDTSRQCERENLPFTAHPHPSIDSQPKSHTWLCPPYLPTCHMWSRSSEGRLAPKSLLSLSLLHTQRLRCKQ